MQVIAFSPTLFYSFGRGDATPNNHFTMGVGYNAGYSSVKGTAYITEDKNNEACFQAGTDFVNGNGSKQSITEICELKDYDSDGFSWGAQVYISYQRNNWLAELSANNSAQRTEDGYRFITREVSFGLSRKLGF